MLVRKVQYPQYQSYRSPEKTLKLVPNKKRAESSSDFTRELFSTLEVPAKEEVAFEETLRQLFSGKTIYRYPYFVYELSEIQKENVMRVINHI